MVEKLIVEAGWHLLQPVEAVGPAVDNSNRPRDHLSTFDRKTYMCQVVA
jgi:hypothetical protein